MIKPGVFSVVLLISVASASIVPEQKSSKVVNGTDAAIADFPYMVSIRRNGGHNCGGSILNSGWIMTAVHCIRNPIEQYMVHGPICHIFNQRSGREACACC